jgi:hypothetical protein
MRRHYLLHACGYLTRKREGKETKSNGLEHNKQDKELIPMTSLFTLRCETQRVWMDEITIGLWSDATEKERKKAMI